MPKKISHSHRSKRKLVRTTKSTHFQGIWGGGRLNDIIDRRVFQRRKRSKGAASPLGDEGDVEHAKTRRILLHVIISCA